MFRTLLVPLDGSPLAERALAPAVELARASGGRLVLFRAAVAALVGTNWAAEQLEAIDDAEAYLSGLARRAAQAVPVETAVAYGSAAAEIVRAAEERHADCIVMATHGRTGLAHLIFGSVAETVLGRTQLPVLLVRAWPGTAEAAPFSPESARLVVALDGSPFAEAALEAAIQLLGPRASLVLTRIVSPPERVLRGPDGRVVAYLDQLADESLAAARIYMEAIAERVHERRPQLQVEVDARFGQPAEGILDAVLEHGADATAMATHGRTGFERMLIGSVAGQVVQAGFTPVLLVRPPALATVGLPARAGEAAQNVELETTPPTASAVPAAKSLV